MKTILMTVLSIFMTTALWAQTVYVTNSANSGAGSLRDAVANAPAGATIDMTGLTSPVILQNAIYINKSLKFVGTPNSTIIDGGGTAHLFNINWGFQYTVELEGLILQRAFNGAIDAGTAHFKASNCIFRDNHKVASGSLNTSSIVVGGQAASLSLRDCVFENNTNINVNLSYQIYSVIAIRSGSVEIMGCEFINNNTLASTVAITAISNPLYPVGNVYIGNCKFKGNTSSYGALSIGGQESNVYITNSVFTGNLKTNNTVGGGSIALFGGPLPATLKYKLTNLTISNNYSNEGGGLYCAYTDKAEIGNCIIAGNHSAVSQAEDIYLHTFGGLVNTTISTMGHNLIGIDPTTGGFSSSSNDLVGTVANPLDPNFVAPTSAAAPTTLGDYQILPCSPAYNSGKDSNVPNDINNYFGLGTTTPLSKDVVGNNRFIGTVDRGAYEQSIATAGNFYYPSGHYHCPGKSYFAPNTGGLTGTFSATPIGLIIDPTTGVIDQKYSAPGSYTISFTTPPNACNPQGNVSTLNYNVLPALTVNVTETISPFWPQPTTSLNAVVSGGSGNYSYAWQGGTPGSTNQVNNPCSGVWYHVNVTDNVTGCTGVAHYYFNNINNRACSSRRRIATSGNGLNSTAWAVYPNPTSGKVTLDLNDVMDNFEVQVVDVTGQVVYRELVKESNRLEFDLSGQATGVYFVNVIAAEEKKSFKVILQ